MRIILVDTNPELVDAWQFRFQNVVGIEVKSGSILDQTADAIVSPANSFGFMDGGIDLAYSEHFGWHVQDAVQESIRREWFGELPVGEALIVQTGSSQVPFLVSAPTMRVPMDVSATLNPYLAFRAVLIALHRHNASASQKIGSVLVPGLGTGVGRVGPTACALQMHAAFLSVQEVRLPERLGEAVDAHWLLLTPPRT